MSAELRSLAARLGGAYVRPLSFHVPITGPSRSAVMGAFEASLGSGFADATMPPGGWPAGSAQALGDQFAWWPGMKN
jgi:hypothetical protein